MSCLPVTTYQRVNALHLISHWLDGAGSRDVLISHPAAAMTSDKHTQLKSLIQRHSVATGSIRNGIQGGRNRKAEPELPAANVLPVSNEK